jgi:hypothetical protein
MDKMLKQLHGQVVHGSRSGSDNTTTTSGGAVQQEVSSTRRIASASNNDSGDSALPLSSQPTTTTSLSENASTLLREIDGFDLFAAIAPGRKGTAAASSQRRAQDVDDGTLHHNRRAPQLSSSSQDDACRRGGLQHESCGIGSDDPIPTDAPPMSDDVMSQQNKWNGEEDEQTPGSQVRYVSRQGGARALLSGGSGMQFVASLQRATQSVYFEELQYEIAATV